MHYLSTKSGKVRPVRASENDRLRLSCFSGIELKRDPSPILKFDMPFTENYI